MRLSAALLRNIMVKAHNDMLAGVGDVNLVRECIKDYIRAQEKVAPYEDAKLIALKVGGDADNPLRVIQEEGLPDISTVGEFMPGFEASAVGGIGAPRNTPAEIVAKLNMEINAGLADPKLKARFAELGSTALALSPVDYGKLIAEETEKWVKVIRAANIKL
jgi:hypothetical protein